MVVVDLIQPSAAVDLLSRWMPPSGLLGGMTYVYAHIGDGARAARQWQSKAMRRACSGCRTMTFEH